MDVSRVVGYGYKSSIESMDINMNGSLITILGLRTPI